MHKELGAEEKEGSCVSVPSCAVAAAEEELAPLLLCWLLGGDTGEKEGAFGDGGDPNLGEKWGWGWFNPHVQLRRGISHLFISSGAQHFKNNKLLSSCIPKPRSVGPNPRFPQGFSRY